MPQRRNQRGFSLIELLIVIAIIAVILGVVIGRGHTMLLGTKEMAVIREIQAIQQAETQYLAQFGRYAPGLKDLGPPENGRVTPEGAGLLPEKLARGRHNGYVFELAGRAASYSIHATPEEFGASGRRTFFSDESLAIRHNWGPEPATVESAEIE